MSENFLSQFSKFPIILFVGFSLAGQPEIVQSPSFASNRLSDGFPHFSQHFGKTSCHWLSAESGNLGGLDTAGVKLLVLNSSHLLSICLKFLALNGEFFSSGELDLFLLHSWQSSGFAISSNLENPGDQGWFWVSSGAG